MAATLASVVPGCHGHADEAHGARRAAYVSLPSERLFETFPSLQDRLPWLSASCLPDFLLFWKHLSCGIIKCEFLETCLWVHEELFAESIWLIKTDYKKTHVFKATPF